MSALTEQSQRQATKVQRPFAAGIARRLCAASPVSPQACWHYSPEGQSCDDKSDSPIGCRMCLPPAKPARPILDQDGAVQLRPNFAGAKPR
jgi:hypothetical protein